MGALPALAIFTFAIGLACTVGARRISTTLGAEALQIAGIQVFALFNPWVYNKVVAGHLLMLLAYAALFLLLAELVKARAREIIIAAILVLIVPQIQFFLIALVALFLRGIRWKTWSPFATGIVLGLPIWIGVLLDRDSLLHVPYTVSWQMSQSVPPAKALMLQGYFPGYAAGFFAWQDIAMCLVVALAFIGILSLRTKRRVAAGIVTTCFLLFAMGTKGPVAPFYTAIVKNIPESGVFRELYDLLGLTAVGYAYLLSFPPSKRFAAAHGSLTLAAALAVASSWAFFPPSVWWVGAPRVPLVYFKAAPNTRYALYPAFQPVTYNGRGSGADPDLHDRSNNVTPLNEYYATYPANAALARYALTGRSDDLSALSVSTIVKRPWLTSNVAALRNQLSGAPPSARITRLNILRISPMPEITLVKMPAVVSLGNRLGAGNVLYSDAGEVGGPYQFWARKNFGMTPVHVSNDFVDGTRGWVDARFAFASRPKLAQGIGGVITSNKNALLAIQSNAMALVSVNGRLLAQDGQLVSSDTAGYKWVVVRSGVTALRCDGVCLVAATAPMFHLPPLNANPRNFEAVPFAAPLPWLIRIVVPGAAFPVLRYNAAYDSNWIAISRWTHLRHFRIDATVNGWLLPKTRGRQVVYVLHIASLLQAVAEGLVLFWLGAVLVRSFRHPRRSRNSHPPTC